MKRRSASAPSKKTFDGYLVALSADKRAALESLRKTIRAAAPKAEECISYGVPAFRLNGRFLVALAAAANRRRPAGPSRPLRTLENQPGIACRATITHSNFA